jgi:hypothetical protein
LPKQNTSFAAAKTGAADSSPPASQQLAPTLSKPGSVVAEQLRSNGGSYSAASQDAPEDEQTGMSFKSIFCTVCSTDMQATF